MTQPVPISLDTVSERQSEQLLFRIDTAARFLDVSSSTVKRLVTNGLLASVTVGTSRRITRGQLLAFVEGLEAGRVTLEPRRAGRKPRS